jgi:hypothetical protein
MDVNINPAGRDDPALGRDDGARSMRVDVWTEL